MNLCHPDNAEFRNENYLLKNEFDWITTNQDWTVFAATVTFKNLKPLELQSGMRLATEYAYKKSVLNKIKKRLSRASSKWNHVIPIDDFIRYEYGQGSFFKPLPKANAPHHIHGLLPVPKELAPRIYDFDKGQLDQRLRKDISSIDTVSTFLFEPLRMNEAQSWFRYMFKDKRGNYIQ